MSKPILPPALRHGDTVALVAPASSPPKEAIDGGIESLASVGLKSKVYRDLSKPLAYLSGTDDQRVGELNQAFRDPEVSGVLAVRGGYGLTRILHRVDYQAIARTPKVVAGYSDITALHIAIQRKTSVVTFHSPNAVDGLGTPIKDEATTESFRQITMHGAECSLQAESPGTIGWPGVKKGKAVGRLVGGNLTLVCTLMGTPYEPDATGALLFLEDTGEAPYRIDRFLSQLRLSGKLSQLAGVAIGRFTDCDPPKGKPTTVGDVLHEYLEPLGVPVVTGLPFGHKPPNLTIPHGAIAELDSDSRTLRVKSPSVRLP